MCTGSCPSATTYTYDDYGRLAGLPDPGTYTYFGTGSSPFHAVNYTSTGDDFGYDANGNMTVRDVDADDYDFAYDRDNRLVDVDKNNAAHFNFVYDGDGNRVKAIDQTTGEVTYYIGNYFEVTVPEEEENPFCSAPGDSIPDNNTNGVDDTITVSGTSGTLTDLNVYLEVDHTKVGQLIVTLEHESTSTVVTLLDRPGHPTPGMCTGDNIDGLFNDGETATAEGSCVSTTPALSGAFDPNGNLSDFNSESLNGNWTLNVSDRGSGDTGTLVSWCLDPTGPSGMGSIGSEPLASAGEGKLPVLASALPQHHFSTGIFSLAHWLARWVVVQWNAHVAGLLAIDIHAGTQNRIHASQSPTGAEVWKSYYYAGGQRIAMRVQDPGATDTDADYYLLGDHLGSTTVTANESGDYLSETRYNPWGEEIYNSGTRPTDYTYTGQYSHAEDFNLLYYVARFYDPYLGHFTQADTILPDAGNPQAYDRYAYSVNNPVNYIDPSGHTYDCGPYDPGCEEEEETSSYCQDHPEECAGDPPSSPPTSPPSAPPTAPPSSPPTAPPQGCPGQSPHRPCEPSDDQKTPEQLILAALALLLQTDAGAFIARFLLQNEITYIFDGGPFIRFVNGGPPEIHLSVNPLLTGTDLTAAIALQLVQEGFHATKPYGDVVTLYEEWAMFSIANGVFEEFQAQGIIGNNFQPFKGFGPNDSFNPRDPKLLIGWFNVHHDKYLKMGLPLYPTDTK